MARQPCSSICSFFHILHFFERSTAQLKLLQKYYLELDLGKVVLLLTKITLFFNFIPKENQERSHLDPGEIKGILY